MLLYLEIIKIPILFPFPWKTTKHDSYFIVRSNVFCRSTKCVHLHYAWCMWERGRNRERERAGWAFIILKCTKMSLGEKRSCVAFEELISLYHLESSVSDSLWKPQFHIFLTASLMIADNVQRLPGSRASNSAWRVSGDWLHWSWRSFLFLALFQLSKTHPCLGMVLSSKQRLSHTLRIPSTKHQWQSLGHLQCFFFFQGTLGQ